MPQGKGTYGSKVGRPPKKKPIKKLAKGDALSIKRRKRMLDPRVRDSGKGMSLREKLRLLEMMEKSGMDMKGIKAKVIVAVRIILLIAMRLQIKNDCIFLLLNKIIVSFYFLLALHIAQVYDRLSYSLFLRRFVSGVFLFHHFETQLLFQS